MGRRPNPIPHERRLISLPVEAWARLEAEAKAAGVPLTTLVAGKILGYPDEYRPAVAAPPPAQTIPPEAWATAVVPPDEAPRPANRLSRVVDTPWTPHPKPGVKR